MSLFSGVGPSHTAALWHVGCGGLLQSSSTSEYLSSTKSGRLSLVDRENASVWYMVSRETAVISGSHVGPRCAVVQCDGPGCALRYLTLHNEEPSTEQEPAVVRVALPGASKVPGADCLLAFSKVLDEKSWLSVRKVDDADRMMFAEHVARCTRSEWFDFRVSVSTIGRGILDASLVKNGVFTSLSGAVSLAVLELSVRFRLRSIHGRVLHVSSTENTPAKKPEVALRKFVPVLQDGPKTGELETSERDLVLEAFRRSSTSRFPAFTLKDAGADRYLSVHPQNTQISRCLLEESVAVLAQQGSCDESGTVVSTVLFILPSERSWGVVHLGGEDRKEERGSNGPDGENVINVKSEVEWLMAGMRGRLETRRHTGAWESFCMEVVEQSFHASLRELPMSDVFAEADAADRSRARAQIAAKVSAVRGGSGALLSRPSASTRSPKKSSFNHAAALAGLGDGAETSSNSMQKGTSRSRSDVPATAGAAGGISSSSLPRNSANRKASKNKKKKKKRSQAQGQNARGSSSSTPVGNPSPSGGSSNHSQRSKQENGTGSTESSGASVEQGVGSSESSVVAPGGASGRPCAACGRPVSGTYTKALGKEFHPQCFCCRMCHRPLLPSAGNFHEHGGAPYCTSCYGAHLAPKCARCSKPILGTTTTAMDRTWHKECLTCVICRLPLTQTFWLYADKPNEPRCSRCVTGGEEPLPGVRYGGQGRRPVNLPGLQTSRLGGTPDAVPLIPSPGGTSGRARLNMPVLPHARARR